MKLLLRLVLWLGVSGLLCSQPSLAQDVTSTGEAAVVETDQYRLVEELWAKGRFAEAIPSAKELVAKTEARFGANHTNTALALFILADLHYRASNYTNAAPLFTRSLAIRENALGVEHPTTAMTINALGLLNHALGNYEKAEQLYRRNLAICEKALGPTHLDTGTAVNNLASLYQMMGDFRKAEPLLKRGLEITEMAAGPDHPETGLALNNLGNFYQTRGAHTKALPLLERSLKITEATLGSEHVDTARVLLNLGLVYFELGTYTQAETFFLRSLKIYVKALGSEHPDTAKAQGNLGELHRHLGDYVKASLFFNHQLEVYQNAFGLKHPATANAMNSLGILRLDMADYETAEHLLLTSLRIYEEIAGSEHSETAMVLGNLGLLYNRICDYPKAESMYQRSLRIREKALGPEHPDVALALHNLGKLYRVIGDLAKAEQMCQRSAGIYQKVLGPNHPTVAATLASLASIYEHMGQQTKADPLILRALDICERTFGPDHPSTAIALNDVALLHSRREEHAKAELMQERCLKILEKVWGQDHPQTAVALENLSLTKLSLRRTDEALELGHKGRVAVERSMGRILAFASERQRLSYQGNANLSLASLLATLGSTLDLAEFTLRTKGMVLDSLLEDESAARASKDPTVRQILDALRTTGRQVAKLQMEIAKDVNPMSLDQRQDRLRRLEPLLDTLQVSLARNVASLGQVRRALRVRVSDVQALLPRSTVLLEFVRYHHFLAKGSAEQRYGVVVIGNEQTVLPGSNSTEPIWVSLGPAESIERNLLVYGAMMRGETKGDTRLLQTLYAQLVEPICKRLPKAITDLVISPDAELSFLSFASLVDAEGRFLAEQYSTRYVASGRDLVFGTTGQGLNRSLAAFANPAFAEKPTSVETSATNTTTVPTMKRADRRDFNAMNFGSLPNTSLEAQFLREKSSIWKLDGAIYLGIEATEMQVKSVKSPYLLHLATHGFFLPEDRTTNHTPFQRGLALDQQTPVVFHNPMHRSGLAFAGAQLTLEAWKRGETPDTENDGILTAQEVASMDLKDTWLVVLSACDTGIGEARNGEGVMGLRRGFVQAGAQNLLMTLWPISDKWSVEIMKAFYEKAMVSGDAPQAMAEVQAEWLAKLRKEKGVLIAARIAGPFVLSTRGRQSSK